MVERLNYKRMNSRVLERDTKYTLTIGQVIQLTFCSKILLGEKVHKFLKQVESVMVHRVRKHSMTSIYFHLEKSKAMAE